MIINNYNSMRYKDDDINSKETDEEGIDIENSEDEEESTSSNSNTSYPDSDVYKRQLMQWLMVKKNLYLKILKQIQEILKSHKKVCVMFIEMVRIYYIKIN